MELEAQLAEVKEELTARKEEVKVMIEEMGKMGRELTRRMLLAIPEYRLAAAWGLTFD